MSAAGIAGGQPEDTLDWVNLRALTPKEST